MFVVPFWVNYVLLCGVALYAMWRGEYEEKTVAIYYAVGCFFANIVDIVFIYYHMNHNSREFYWLDIFMQASDVVFFGAIMLQSKKYWTIFACALAICEVMTSAAHTLTAILPWAYGSAQKVWFYMILLVIFFGTRVVEVRRRDLKKVLV